ncbi:MAG: hypothetical protein FWC97_03405 [Treponema sp.]|nr:hypothetical protein [Treponema sp.]
MKHHDTIEELLKATEGEHYEFKEAKNKYEFYKFPSAFSASPREIFSHNPQKRSTIS